MAYKKDVDYQALINEAVARKDYTAAAQYEQQRNEKIADLDATGANQWGAAATNKYQGWLDPTDYGTVGKQQMAAGASADDVLATYNKRYNKAATTEGLTQYANDEVQKEMWDYITANLNKPEASFDYSVAQPTYQSQYGSQIDQLLQDILQREDFSYDVGTDPLYAQYARQYNREGNRAMNDTLASVASGAGGLNSYAVTAAQQANDYYATQLGDKIPELYQMAYDMYLNDKADQVENLGLLQQMDATQYNRYRDTMSDWRSDRDFAYGQYRDQVGDWQWDKTWDYNVGRDEIADQRYDQEFDYGVSRDEVADQQWQQQWDYGVGRDEVEDSRYERDDAYDRAMKLLNTGIMPEAEQLQTAGISEDQAKQILAALGYGTYGTGGSYSSGGSGYRGGGDEYDEGDDDDATGTGMVDPVGANSGSGVKPTVPEGTVAGTLTSKGSAMLKNLQSGSKTESQKVQEITQAYNNGNLTQRDVRILLNKLGLD